MNRRTALVRRTALFGGALVLSVIGISATGAVAQAGTYNPGVGITHCNAHWSGTMKFSPGLTTGGTATSETVTITAADKPCTGGAPTPAGMKLKGMGTITSTSANDCNNFFFNPPPGTKTLSFAPNFAGVIKWAPTSITASHFNFPTALMKTTTAAAPVQFKATGVTVTGSYPTTTGKIQFNTALSLSSILNICNTSGAVLSAVDIAGPGSIGTF